MTDVKKEENSVLSTLTLIVGISIIIIVSVFIISAVLSDNSKNGIIDSLNDINNISNPAKPSVRIPTKELPSITVPVPVQPVKSKHKN